MVRYIATYLSIFLINLQSSKMPGVFRNTPLPKKREGKRGFKLDGMVLTAGQDQIQQVIQEMNLDVESDQVVISGSTGTTLGTDPVAVSTIIRYQTIWKAFRDFCILIKDFESAIILDRENCPANPPPVKYATAVLFLRFRCCRQGEILKHPTTDQDFTIDGAHLRCKGDWQSEVSVELFRTSLSKLHSHYESTTGAYQPACEACLRHRNNPEGAPACTKQGHTQEPILKSTGCITESKKFKSEIAAMKMKVARWYDEPRRTKYWLPDEQHTIRNRLLSANEIGQTMLWVIINIACKMYLRCEEVVGMKYSDFLVKYTMACKARKEAGGVMGTVQGKRDNGPVKLMLWDDEDCPEFSAFRSLMMWLELTGIEGEDAYLFPTMEQLNARGKSRKSWKPTEHYTKDHLLNDVRYICLKILGKVPSDDEILGKQASSLVW
jgi:hypothetical protein